MSKKLAMNTTVEGETYAAGTVPPAEVAEKITNPKAWGETPADDDTPAEDEPSGKQPSKQSSNGK